MFGIINSIISQMKQIFPQNTKYLITKNMASKQSTPALEFFNIEKINQMQSHATQLDNSIIKDRGYNFVPSNESSGDAHMIYYYVLISDDDQSLNKKNKIINKDLNDQKTNNKKSNKVFHGNQSDETLN
ncbi:hypothetical protein EDEG_03876 [Edhazardia aedis USNM 41457]|uniref:Uncharacterized protein n=1 Tax=Edhazardia aedis (strain USNM 41457) TaxID=1003232 RepID=J9DJP6_EDHAE|nr:hypothetical protein EDEG_03876 [Edhazardia aedis USNM 41457]|eukprot:EJW01557.1 hypothetical protein EDEG_03876 [Edhazardia aedis USNM 41457]